MTDEVIEQGSETIAPELVSARREATRFGWTDKDQWITNGHSEDEWVDADAFLKRGKDYNGFLRKQNEALQGQLDELRDTMEAFKEHHNKVAETAYKKALGEIKAARKAALKEGNLELVAELEDQIDAAEAEAPQPIAKKNEAPVADPRAERVFNEWVSENPWYNTRAGRAMAESIGKDFQGKLFGRQFLDAVAEGVQQELPHLFENGARTRGSAVDSGGSRGASRSGPKGQSWSDIPEDDRKHGEKFIKQGLFKDRAAYAKEYFEIADEE